MTKREYDVIEQFLDEAGPMVQVALKGDKAEFDRVMERVMHNFLQLDLGHKTRKPRTVKKKVRRGIGSY